MTGRDLLREYQRKAGITQTELASRFGVTSAYVSMLLSGARTVTRNEIAQRIEAETSGSVPASAWVHSATRPRASHEIKTPRGVRNARPVAISGVSGRRATKVVR